MRTRASRSPVASPTVSPRPRSRNVCPASVPAGRLIVAVPSELAPLEDDGVLLYQTEAPPNTSLDQLARYNEALIATAVGIPEIRNNFHFNGGRAGRPSTAFGGLGFTPSSERERTVAEMMPVVQQATPA